MSTVSFTNVQTIIYYIQLYTYFTFSFSFQTDDFRCMLHIKIGLAMYNCLLKREYSYLKPKQIQTIHSLLAGIDTIAVLPTGYGKSLIYELVPFVHQARDPTSDFAIIIITPLNSIIHQQITKCGITAVEVSTNFIHVKRQLEHSPFKYLIGHPENMTTKEAFDGLQEAFTKNKKVTLAAIIIDEAHCVVKWGPDFRPAFLEIGELEVYIYMYVE